MQEIDEELQECLTSMIESAKDKYFENNSGGFFLGGSLEENARWYWHNGEKIKVDACYLAVFCIIK